MHYQIIKVGKEEVGLVWDDSGKKTRVEYIYLPNPKRKLKELIIKDFPEINKITRRIPGGIDDRIAKLYFGKKENIDLSLLNLSRLTDFSAKVLKQACKIQRGKVATYSGLAGKIGVTGAARAVGTALANNPFPLIMPCHRVVRADGSLGGFGGGLAMKRELLRKEGISLDRKRRVPAKYFWK
ncbi:MAG: MGMT family protein [Smithellaceae bacterium]|jgi:methylated-DNA-[protein]-cysteine S-methyltransferase